MGQPVTITLTVNDADGLYNNRNAKNLDVASYCSLGDTSNIPHTGSGKEFETHVYIGNSVTWKSAVKTQPTRTPWNAGIDKIVFEPGKDNDVDFFLGQANDISGTVNSTSAGTQNSSVTARVNDDVNLNNAIDVYTIYFTIYQPFTRATAQFFIDPKLQGHN